VSLPSLGAWIETRQAQEIQQKLLSLPSLGAWIETRLARALIIPLWSLPSLGAWIETLSRKEVKMKVLVAPFTGSVD